MISNTTSDVGCDCTTDYDDLSSNSTTTEAEAVLKVFTIDFKKTDILELMGPRFEEHKNGQIKLDVTVVSGFDALFSEIENDARLGLGLFDVCK